MYDLAVQKNQSTLAATAIKTTAILSQLFPQEVHDRLFASPLAANDKAHLAPKFRMRESIKSDDGGRRKSHISLDTERKASKDAPIADLFPNCTGTVDTATSVYVSAGDELTQSPFLSLSLFFLFSLYSHVFRYRGCVNRSTLVYSFFGNG
jgi:hypothetical protein